MYTEDPVIVKADISFGREIIIKDYTAKLVKSILINGNPELAKIFKKDKDLPPKLIHITPLYVVDEDGTNVKIKAVYSRLISGSSSAKPPLLDKIKPVKLEPRRRYVFFIGTSVHLLNQVLTALSNANELFFGNELVEIDSISYEVNYVDFMGEVRSIAKLFRDGDVSSMKVVFSSPTLLKDPLAILRKRKKKLFLPLPEAVLSTPMFMALIDSGRFRSSIFLRCMRYVKSIFDIPYTALKSVNIVWYVYDNEALPALIGYTKYYIDYEVLNHVQRVVESKYNLDFIELLARSLVLARIYGVGDGRATGFGHITLHFPSN